MESLVVANLSHRPLRALVTALGVAIGTVLILLIVGLAHGVLKDRGTRESSMASEIMLRPQGSFTTGVSSNVLALPVEYVDQIKKIPGVKSVTPLVQYLQQTDSGLGFRVTDGIDFDSYVATTGIRLISGHAPTSDEEVVVDEEYAQSHNYVIGSEVQTLDRKFKLAGVYTPQVGARIKGRLSMIQEMMSASGRCSTIFVRCENPADQEKIGEAINKILPDLQIIYTKDIPRLYEQGIPAINTFLKVMVGLAIFISTLVILLAMYTAITERTREIGVLKSLGASNFSIVWTIEKEALLISTLGILIGYAIAFITKLLLVQFTSLKNIDYELTWILITAGVGLAGGLLGALYPAIYAARKDPVEALSYE